MSNNPNTNFLASKPNVTEEDVRTLNKAKAQERERIKQGWGYYIINKRIKILVPYDKNGELTTMGKKMVERAKANFV